MTSVLASQSLSTRRRKLLLAALCGALALGTMATMGCRSDGKGAGPPVPASSDPDGKDLVEGAIVLAKDEKRGTIRIYKLTAVKYFPPPVGDELMMIAFNEMGNDFRHASDLWAQRKLTVAIPKVRVQRQMFNKRDYRVIQNEPVSEQEKNLKADEVFPQLQQSKPAAK